MNIALGMLNILISATQTFSKKAENLRGVEAMDPKLPPGNSPSVGKNISLCSFILCFYDIFMLGLFCNLISPQQLYRVWNNQEGKIKDLLQSRCWHERVKEKQKLKVFQFTNEKEKLSMGDSRTIILCEYRKQNYGWRRLKNSCWCFVLKYYLYVFIILLFYEMEIPLGEEIDQITMLESRVISDLTSLPWRTLKEGFVKLWFECEIFFTQANVF